MTFNQYWEQKGFQIVSFMAPNERLVVKDICSRVWDAAHSEGYDCAVNKLESIGNLFEQLGKRYG